jgi:hypothetical protein
MIFHRQLLRAGLERFLRKASQSGRPPAALLRDPSRPSRLLVRTLSRSASSRAPLPPSPYQPSCGSAGAASPDSGPTFPDVARASLSHSRSDPSPRRRGYRPDPPKRYSPASAVAEANKSVMNARSPLLIRTPFFFLMPLGASDAFSRGSFLQSIRRTIFESPQGASTSATWHSSPPGPCFRTSRAPPPPG